MRTLVSASLAALALGGATVMLSTDQAHAQQSKSITAEYQRADAREALRDVLRRAGVSFTIAPDVQGIVTASMKNVSFESALQNLTRQVDATYRVEGDTYQIVRRAPTDASPTGPVVTAPEDNVSVELSFAQIREALDKLFKDSPRSFTVDPRVNGYVTATLRNLPRMTALQTILRQVNATYRMEGNIVEIVPLDPTPQAGGMGGGFGGGGFGGSAMGGLGGSGQGAGGFGGGMAQPAQAAPALKTAPAEASVAVPGIPASTLPTAVTQDDRFLYVVRGNHVWKLQKSDLKTVAEGDFPGALARPGKAVPK